VRTAALAELRRRAAAHAAQPRLLVDYWRIRRRIAYPLPVRAYVVLPMPLRMDLGDDDYPWGTWLVWALEERIDALGWAAELAGDRRARAAASADLDALAAWPSYRQYAKPDLVLGHCARLLATARARWTWPGAALRRRLDAALRRLLAASLPLVERHYAPYPSVEAILAHESPRAAVHNIPLIGTLGLAMAARVVGDADAVAALERRIAIVLGATLALMERGWGEGTAYDGYVLDFVMAWLARAPEAVRAPILAHPSLERIFAQSYALGAPGDAMQVAEIGDVEPDGMPFHATAQARRLALAHDPRAAWWLARCEPRRLRAAALAEIALLRRGAARAPAAGAIDAHAAVVLRSGWERRDLAAACAVTRSPMHHMHHDGGHLLVGADGRWLISDPGYQQYQATSERAFTLDAQAHNAPVIAGRHQAAKACRVLALGRDRGAPRTALDLTACYPRECGATRVTRTVWLLGRDRVVAADRIDGEVADVRWHWHAHPDAAWWWSGGVAELVLGDATMRLACPGITLGAEMVERLRGSRGQLTLGVRGDPRRRVHWWVFSRGPAPRLRVDGARLRIDRITLEAT